MTNLATMKKEQLKGIARDMGIKGYSSMTKAQLIGAINDKTIVDVPFEECALSSVEQYEELLTTEQDTPIDSIVTAEEQKTLNSIKAFDFDRYANYDPSRISEYSKKDNINSHQINLVVALQNNFKVSIDTKTCSNRYELSVKIAKVYAAIKEGKVTKRSDEEILERVRAYKAAVKPVVEYPATPAQLKLINDIEKRSGLINTKVVSNKKIASEIITNMLAREKNMASVNREVAVTCADKLENQSFRFKFSTMMKRVFA